VRDAAGQRAHRLGLGAAQLCPLAQLLALTEWPLVVRTENVPFVQPAHLAVRVHDAIPKSDSPVVRACAIAV
jgi:hypothetical protein